MKKRLYDKAKIKYIHLGLLRPSFIKHPSDILVKSVCRYGILFPVISIPDGKQLRIIKGNCRYFAAKKAGLSTIPCIILDMTPQEGEAFLLSSASDPLKKAEHIYKLTHIYGVSIESLSRYSGLSSSEIEAKLRLLTFPLRLIRHAFDIGLTESEIIFIIQTLPYEKASSLFSKLIVEGYCLVHAREYIESVFNPQKSKFRIAVSDIRMFLNVLKRASDMMKSSGYDIIVNESPIDNGVTVNIEIRSNSVCIGSVPVLKSNQKTG